MPLRAVTQFTSLSRATVYRRMKEGSFPKPIKIGPNRVVWRFEDLDAWLSDCVATAH
ncbi:hypothetical protein CKO20_06005 [Rhodocyclus tenuis]|nr:hypothetical protein [Rhodocyclus tenuis]